MGRILGPRARTRQVPSSAERSVSNGQTPARRIRSAPTPRPPTENDRIRIAFEPILHSSFVRCAFFLLWLGCASFPSAADSKRPSYDVDYTVAFLPADGVAAVTITTEARSGHVSRLRLRMPKSRYSAVEGDGQIVRDGKYIVWEPPRKGGSLRYRYRVDHERRSGGFDARMTEDWVIVRGDDLIPSASVRATRDADSRARLKFSLPEGWTNVDTPFVMAQNGKEFVVVDPSRRFDRPKGWIIAGKVGTRREWIEDTEVSVAGPKGEDVRRNDTLAFVNLTLPQMKRAFGELPSKLLIVSARDPMWRGGLSGPRSLFLHADRPLISENGTSSLVHELVHVVTRLRGADDDDWIVEGLAEFYSVELMRRAGLLSKARHEKALDWMRDYGKPVHRLSANRSSGRVTARAVMLLDALDGEIRARTDDDASLDDVTQALMKKREVSRRDLAELVEKLTGEPSEVLASPLLDAGLVPSSD